MIQTSAPLERIGKSRDFVKGISLNVTKQRKRKKDLCINHRFSLRFWFEAGIVRSCRKLHTPFLNTFANRSVRDKKVKISNDSNKWRKGGVEYSKKCISRLTKHTKSDIMAVMKLLRQFLR